MIQVCWRKKLKLFFGCCRYQGIFLERVSILCANGVFCVSPQVVGADDVASVLEGGSSLLYGHLGRMLEGFNRDLIQGPVLRTETATNHQNRWIITTHNLKIGDFCFVDVLAFSKQAFWASILVFLGDIVVDIIRERPHGSELLQRHLPGTRWGELLPEGVARLAEAFFEEMAKMDVTVSALCFGWFDNGKQRFTLIVETDSTYIKVFAKGIE